jgi:hypothetical protein
VQFDIWAVRETPNFGIIGQTQRALYIKTYERFVAAGAIEALSSSEMVSDS